MAWTSVGFDGTITEIQWAGLSSLLGNGYVAAGSSDCAVTAVAGARSVSVAAGSLYGDGVQSTNSGAETVALTTPVNGQWYLVCLRRTWATNTAELVAVAGATTTTSLPSAPPITYPTINTDPGVLTDQPIAWAWCNSANTTVVVSDLRKFPVRTQESLGNCLINGGMDIWQRGTSFSNPSNGSFTSDRWSVRRDGTGFTSSITQYVLSNTELNGTGLKNALIYSVSTVGSGNTYNGLINRIEDVRTLENKTITVSFWAKNVSGSSSITPIIQNYYGTGGSTQTFNSGSEIVITETWAKYSQVIQVSSVVGKTIGSGNFNGLIFNFSAGVTIQVAITGVQVEVGSVATPFRRNAHSIQGELAACQRYYQRFGGEQTTIQYSLGFTYSTTQGTFHMPLVTSMRVPPTSIEYGGSLRVQEFNLAARAVSSLSYVSTFQSESIAAVISTHATGNSGVGARLQASNEANTYIAFSAEL